MSQNNNNLSIDEILREAQEVLSSIGGANAAHEGAEEDVKTYEPKKKDRADKDVSDKQSTGAEEAESVKEFHPDKTANKDGNIQAPDDKTKAIPRVGAGRPANDKTMRVPVGKNEKSRFFKRNSADEEYGSTPPQII